MEETTMSSIGTKKPRKIHHGTRAPKDGDWILIREKTWLNRVYINISVKKTTPKPSK